MSGPLDFPLPKGGRTMKAAELRAHATCALCDQKIGASGVPLFWVVTVERFGVDLGAIKRHDGLAAVLGGNQLLAGVMGPNEDLAQSMMSPTTVTICERCSSARSALVAELAELGDKSS